MSKTSRCIVRILIVLLVNHFQTTNGAKNKLIQVKSSVNCF